MKIKKNILIELLKSIGLEESKSKRLKQLKIRHDLKQRKENEIEKLLIEDLDWALLHRKWGGEGKLQDRKEHLKDRK